MISFPDSICPLCSQVFAREHLHEHIAAEQPRLRQSTIKLIQGYHPGWVEDHGACGPCWRSYRDAGQALNAMKRGRSQSTPVPWKPVELMGKVQDRAQTIPPDPHGRVSYGPPA